MILLFRGRPSADTSTLPGNQPRQYGKRSLRWVYLNRRKRA